jgi:DNA-binding beta-propeller fold protein YncE
MSNALIRTSHVLLGFLLGILFAGNMSAKERPLGHGSSHKIEAPGARFGAPIQIANWGNFGSPVAGSTESTPGYDGAEFFAGPDKFANSGDDDYFHGVLPNGRIAKPAGASTQVGMNPLGIVLTPDGKFAIVSNDDERKGDLVSLRSAKNHGGYSLSVLDTSTTPMTVVSQINSSKKLFIGLAATMNPDGTYAVYASGGGDNSIKLFHITSNGQISQADDPASIPILPLLPANQGWVSNYTIASTFNLDAVPSPAGNSKRSLFGLGAKITFPAGCALTSDGRYLVVACNGDNSIAVIDTGAKRVVAQYEAGYFPYAVAISPDKTHVVVSNWGLTAYKFVAPSYGSETKLTAIAAAAGPHREPDEPAGFFVPKTDSQGPAAKTSSLSIFHFKSVDPTKTRFSRAIPEGKPLDALQQVGDTHPSAMAIVTRKNRHALYVTRTNDDSVGVVDLDHEEQTRQINLPWIRLELSGNRLLTGTYPNALIASRDGRKLFVAEGGINAVAVLDTSDLFAPKLIGRIATGWWPAALAISPDDKILYVVNAKGIGEDINPATNRTESTPAATGVESFEDSNFIFGTVEKVPLNELKLSGADIDDYNIAKIKARDDSVVPAGGKQASKKIKCVIFIEHENKSFDSILGESSHFKPFSSTTFHHLDGSAFSDTQYGAVTKNTRLLAETFATAVNYYSDSEESDAGHQFCASGTATDYTEKTLLVKDGRGLLVNKNMEPEDYPATGYIFNNAARNGVSFKDYGELVRIDGTDTGNSLPPTFDDPTSGKMGYPIKEEKVPVEEFPGSDVDSKTQGLGQAYFLDLPVLAVLGKNNRNGEPHLDKNYPGYNFNISDQRRALEFISDFDRMAQKGTLPRFLYIYLPNDHTGETTADSFGIDPKTGKPVRPEPAQQVEDGDVALGMVVEHLMKSTVYYDKKTDTGAAIFITFDDAQSTHDHIHPHRTPLIVVSPFAKPGYVGKQHYSTASIVKTEELLLGLPPNNLGDLVATDLYDLFQPNYNHVEVRSDEFNRVADYRATPAGQAIWALVTRLDTAEPDRDSRRLGALARLSMKADSLYRDAEINRSLDTGEYFNAQRELIEQAEALVSAEDD